MFVIEFLLCLGIELLAPKLFLAVSPFYLIVHVVPLALTAHLLFKSSLICRIFFFVIYKVTEAFKTMFV